MDLISILIDWAPYLLIGIFVTLGLTAAGLGLGVIIGLPMAIGQVYSTGIRWIDKIMKAFIAVFVWFFRGLPILVLLFLFYFGIFPLLGMGDLAPFFVGAIVLGLRGASYQSQIFRGAIQSISEGQMTAARSLGMTKLSASCRSLSGSLFQGGRTNTPTYLPIPRYVIDRSRMAPPVGRIAPLSLKR